MDALTFLGTGGGIPTADRGHSSLLLEEGGRRWLLDAGEPCSQRLKAMGVPLASLDAVFISHGHSDHLSGLPMVIQGAWLEGRRQPLPIYLPGELIAPLRAWLDAVYLPEKLVGFPLEFHAWEQLSGTSVLFGGGKLRVSANPTTHLNGLRALIDETGSDRFHAFSMAFDWPDGKRLIYSADLGRPDDLTSLLAQPCDLLVCELAHFEPEELFSYLLDKPVRRLALTHFKAKFNTREAEICEMGATCLSAATEVAVMRDGTRLEF